MPRKETDYSRTVIYKIVCNDLEIKDVYIGHTTDFIKRKNLHKSSCNNEKCHKYNYKIYETIRLNGGWSNWTMIEIEKYPCHDGNEARTRERFWYEQLNANMNTCVPNRSQKEWVENNKDKHDESVNKNNIPVLCECGILIKKYNKQKHFKRSIHLENLKSLQSI